MSQQGRTRRGMVAATAGAGGGLLSGILGGGGGAVMVPFMTGPLRMAQHAAHGTSLAVITLTALAAAVAYSLHEPLSATLILALGAGALPGAFLGARIAAKIPAMQLRQLFGLFLLVVSARLLFWDSASPLFTLEGSVEAWAAAGIGLVGGFASGALGIGGGSIFVPALVLLLGTGQHAAQGISLWVVVAASAVGGFTHYRQGTVDVAAVRWMVPAALPSALLGAAAAGVLSGRSLQIVFAGVLTAIGVQMVWTARRRVRVDRVERVALAADAA